MDIEVGKESKNSCKKRLVINTFAIPIKRNFIFLLFNNLIFLLFICFRSSIIFANKELLLEYDVAIIGGLGHIGLPLGILFANKKINVLLVDSYLEHNEKVMSGEMPFLEYGAEDILKKAFNFS